MGRGKVVVAVSIALTLLVVLMALSFVVGWPGLGIGAPGFALVLFLLIAAAWALVIAAVLHALLRDDLTGAQKLVWIAISIFVTPIVPLGALAYFVLGRDRTRGIFQDLGRPRAGA